MIKLGSELEFISKIKRDGSGTVPVTEEGELHLLQKEEFTILGLSMTEKTYIASGFNSFIVKLKKEETVEEAASSTWEEINSQFKEGVNPHPFILGFKYGAGWKEKKLNRK